MFGVTSAVGASLAGSKFEIDTDANLTVQGASPAIDWVERHRGSVRGTRPRVSKTTRIRVAPRKTTRARQRGTGSIPNNKSDLKVFGSYHEPGPTATHPGFLNVFWTRVQEPTGTTNMDFEFNKLERIATGLAPV